MHVGINLIAKDRANLHKSFFDNRLVFFGIAADRHTDGWMWLTEIVVDCNGNNRKSSSCTWIESNRGGKSETIDISCTSDTDSEAPSKNNMAARIWVVASRLSAIKSINGSRSMPLTSSEQGREMISDANEYKSTNALVFPRMESSTVSPIFIKHLVGGSGLTAIDPLEVANASTLAAFKLLPMTNGISPNSCIIFTISSVLARSQSVNRFTNNGTLSMLLMWGRTCSMPTGSCALFGRTPKSSLRPVNSKNVCKLFL